MDYKADTIIRNAEGKEMGMGRGFAKGLTPKELRCPQGESLRVIFDCNLFKLRLGGTRKIRVIDYGLVPKKTWRLYRVVDGVEKLMNETHINQPWFSVKLMAGVKYILELDTEYCSADVMVTTWW